MTLYRLTEILNAEGTIAAIYKDNDDTLYIQGRLNLGQTIFIAKTNRFLLELYLRSRINLKYLLSHDSQIIQIQKNQATEKHIDTTSESITQELKDLKCGGALYDLLPRGMKSDLSVDGILGKLPEVKDGIIMSVIENFKTKPSSVQFFSEDSPFQLVQIVSEVHNPFEFDFLKVKLKTDNSYLLCKVNPNLLKLLFMNQIALQEYFKAQSHYEYFYFSGKEWYKFFYSTAIEGMIQNIQYGNLTYYSLPKEWQVESVMGLWDYYTKNIVLSGGYGIQSADFQNENPVNVELK